MYAIVDIETTGGYAESHRITEIAIFIHNGNQVIDRFHTLVNPERKIPHYITGLTGITQEMVVQAPRFSDIASEVHKCLEGNVFVAHNAHFDYSFLKKEFELAGINWQSKKLCTVKLSRKIIPGLTSYSLGSLASALGIQIDQRHRAGGDASTAVKIFDHLLLKDQDQYIAKALKRNAGETMLPPNLSKEEFDRLPSETGVYYFMDKHGQVIYVGKAINIKKRVASHFTGESREWGKTRIRQEIHHIKSALTGTELIALLLEVQEIRRLWPKYNQALKFKTEEWGIFGYEDRNGYLRFSVNMVHRGAHPMVRFSAKGDAWNFLWEKVREFDLCPKLSGLQLAKGLCFDYQSGSCRGACLEIEPTRKYNKRAQRAIQSFTEEGETVALIGRGRQHGEKSIILVERGIYVGFGFMDGDCPVEDVASARKYITPAQEVSLVQNLVNSYLMHPKDMQVVVL